MNESQMVDIKMKSFNQILEEKRRETGWNNAKTIAYYSELLGRSEKTVYRWQITDAPKIVRKLLNQRVITDDKI